MFDASRDFLAQRFTFVDMFPPPCPHIVIRHSTQSERIRKLLPGPCVCKMRKMLMELLQAGFWWVGEPFWELMQRSFPAGVFCAS
jgi:hypothetical protein